MEAKISNAYQRVSSPTVLGLGRLERRRHRRGVVARRRGMRPRDTPAPRGRRHQIRRRRRRRAKRARRVPRSKRDIGMLPHLVTPQNAINIRPNRTSRLHET